MRAGAPDSIDLYDKTRWRSSYNSSTLKYYNNYIGIVNLSSSIYWYCQTTQYNIL